MLFLKRNYKMKFKNITLSLAGLIVFGMLFMSCESNDNPVLQTNNSTANSKVLMEFFTAVNCPNCPPPGYFLDNIDSLKGVTINDTNVIIIRYHSNFNGFDPYYLYNPSSSAARHSYYAYSWNPAGSLMGTSMPSYDQNAWLNTINTQLEKNNPVEVGISNTYDTVSRSGTVNVSLLQTSTSSVSDLKLFIVITESELYYAGSNGEKYHQNTFRNFLTDNAGDNVSLQTGVLLNVSKNYSLNSAINHKNSHIIVFVQSTSGKTVYGVEEIRF